MTLRASWRVRRVPEGRNSPAFGGGEPDARSPIVTTLVSTLLAAAAPAFLFLAGWMFLKTFLAPFGIQAAELGLDAWQVSALSLSGIPLGSGQASGVLGLQWLLFLSLAIVTWLIPVPVEMRNARTIIAGVLLLFGAILGTVAFNDLMATAKSVSSSIIQEQGPLFIPVIEGSSSTEPPYPGSFSPATALDDCVDGEQVKPIFVVNQKAWLFCAPDPAFKKGLIFVVGDDNKLISMRRIDLP